jgi:hypothetical protein
VEALITVSTLIHNAIATAYQLTHGYVSLQCVVPDPAGNLGPPVA